MKPTNIARTFVLMLSMLSLSIVASPLERARATNGSLPGPRMDLNIIPYANQGTEFTGLQTGAIDLMDSPLTMAQQAAANTNIAQFTYDGGKVEGVKKPYWVGAAPLAPQATYGIINCNNIGPGTCFWTLFNGYDPFGGANINWGFASPMVDPNPVTAAGASDNQLLMALYDSGLAHDPYDFATWRAWIFGPETTLGHGSWLGTLVASDYPNAGATYVGGGSVLHFNIQTGIDLGGGLGTVVRFHPHPILTLPGPDNMFGTVDDVIVPATPAGKILDGSDVKASIEYVKDHVGFRFGSVAGVIDVKFCDSTNANCLKPGADGVLYTGDDALALLGNGRHVDVYFDAIDPLARNKIAELPIIPSEIWSIGGTPGIPADDPIPNPTMFSCLDPDGNGVQADHVLYGTGAWLFNPAFTALGGGILPKNTHYFTPARTPIDIDVDGVKNIALPGDLPKAAGVDVADVQQAVLQFVMASPYQVRFDTNFDRKTDLDDMFIVIAYYQYGVNPINPALPVNPFRTWPDMG